MAVTEQTASASATEQLESVSAAGPFVFISHDSRDSELAEAFGKLLKSVSAGMVKTFSSSDKKGTAGIDFGEEWYKRLMAALQSTSDIVCLFTERSLDRPWILFEAGVAKGKLETPVIGLALGVPLARITTGPFYQFMNMDDSVEDLTKLVNQLARRVPGLELDADVVAVQVAAFRKTEGAALKKLSSGTTKHSKQDVEETQVAKLLEEMKALPSRVAERLAESGDPLRRRRFRRFHPMMIEELMHSTGSPTDPVGILMAASMIREDAPWLYELAVEAYRVAKTGDAAAVSRELVRLKRFTDIASRGPFMEEMGLMNRESHFAIREFPRVLTHMLSRTLEAKKASPKRRSTSKKSPGRGAP